MLDKKHLNDLQAKFNNLSDEELLNLLTLERQNYSAQAIEIADEIAVRRQLEYTVPEFIDESKPEHAWYINAGFILLCAVMIASEFYLSSIFERDYARVAGSVARNGFILILAYKSVPFSRFSFIYFILTAMALLAGTFGNLFIAILILGLMYLLKFTVFNRKQLQ